MELISREEVKTILECITGYHQAIKDAFDRVMELPTIESRPKGRWGKTITYYPYCSICEWMPEDDEMTHELYNFCPNCGADMRGGEE